MIRIHEIRLVSSSVAEAEVTWGDNLEHRDWFRLESRIDEHLGAPVVKPSVPHDFSVYFAQWLWTISAAVSRARQGQKLEFPLDITSCRKPGLREPTETEKASAALWRKIRDLQGKLFRHLPDEDRALIATEIEQLQRDLEELERESGTNR